MRNLNQDLDFVSTSSMPKPKSLNRDLDLPKVKIIEAGVTFDNSFFDNFFVSVRQLKNRSFLGPVFVHVTG